MSGLIKSVAFLVAIKFFSFGVAILLIVVAEYWFGFGPYITTDIPAVFKLNLMSASFVGVLFLVVACVLLRLSR